MSQEEAAEELDVEETGRFGDTKRYIARHVFVVDALVEEVN